MPRNGRVIWGSTSRWKYKFNIKSGGHGRCAGHSTAPLVNFQGTWWHGVSHKKTGNNFQQDKDKELKVWTTIFFLIGKVVVPHTLAVLSMGSMYCLVTKNTCWSELGKLNCIRIIKTQVWRIWLWVKNKNKRGMSAPFYTLLVAGIHTKEKRQNRNWAWERFPRPGTCNNWDSSDPNTYKLNLNTETWHESICHQSWTWRCTAWLVHSWGIKRYEVGNKETRDNFRQNKEKGLLVKTPPFLFSNSNVNLKKPSLGELIYMLILRRYTGFKTFTHN